MIFFSFQRLLIFKKRRVIKENHVILFGIVLALAACTQKTKLLVVGFN
jgi:hypothetical protein